ncbi:MAG: hypothetical protein JWO44_1036 [Bacteroidetes bacterium]|nr:hypothetical protein [Bacteroidota bacterium]
MKGSIKLFRYGSRIFYDACESNDVPKNNAQADQHEADNSVKKYDVSSDMAKYKTVYVYANDPCFAERSGVLKINN